MAIEELEALIGKPFPGGTYAIEPYQHWLMMDAVGGAATRTGTANPMYVYYAALAGMGISVDELFHLVGATAEDGPMFGETTLEAIKPLEVGATYSVSGGITSVIRKEGRKAGVFDIVEFRLELRDASGELVGVNTNSFIFPRRD
ncbi:MAG: hypothetical protein FJW96_06625 [Actinobacteria bacterium]|nr:hypothetical protein [Actinomycetota bacterium]